MNVAIRGDGVAAYCCAHLLKAAGFQVALERASRPRLPAIMLSDAALALIRDAFGRQDLLTNMPRIRRRVVAWGENAEPRTLDHSAVVVSEEELLKELKEGLSEDDHAPDEADFTIFASNPLPAATTEQRFGSRKASAARVRLKDERDSGSCWIESLADGWLFLIPNAAGAGWVLSVGGPAEALLERSRVIAEKITLASNAAPEFFASPRIVSPLCGHGWMACGTAAMAFDPICGDGTAHAIREAILAAAVVRAIAGGGDAEALLSHYEARLTVGFQRHLALCRDFYSTGGGGRWWDRELSSLHAGLNWCARKVSDHSEFRYRLIGFELKNRD